jgi:hypothetical protein
MHYRHLYSMPYVKKFNDFNYLYPPRPILMRGFFFWHTGTDRNFSHPKPCIGTLGQERLLLKAPTEGVHPFPIPVGIKIFLAIEIMFPEHPPEICCNAESKAI